MITFLGVGVLNKKTKVMVGGSEWVEPRRYRVGRNRRDQQNDEE